MSEIASKQAAISPFFLFYGVSKKYITHRKVQAGREFRPVPAEQAEPEHSENQGGIKRKARRATAGTSAFLPGVFAGLWGVVTSSGT